MVFGWILLIFMDDNLLNFAEIGMSGT